jgi:hypothetical protein
MRVVLLTKSKAAAAKAEADSHQACSASCNRQSSAGAEDGNVFGREPVGRANIGESYVLVICLGSQRKLIDRKQVKRRFGTAEQVMTPGNRRNSLHCGQLAAGTCENSFQGCRKAMVTSSSETMLEPEYGDG